MPHSKHLMSHLNSIVIYISALTAFRTASKGQKLIRQREPKRNTIFFKYNRFGTNTQRLRKIKTLWELILENFEDHILRILLLAATCSLVIGVIQHGWKAGWVEGLAIFIAVGVIISVTAGNNYIKEKQFQKLF